MKLSLFSMLILFTGQWTFSQSWNPFPKNQNSYFKQQDATSTKVESFLMDSTINMGKHQILYFNAKSELKDACNSSLRKNIYKMYLAKNPNKIDSLLLTGDSLLFIGSVDSKPDTFIFKPFSKLNDSWITNGINIRCAEVGVKDIFGEPDSIKTFRCNGRGYNVIELILSKSHGFIKFLPFNEFLNYSPQNVLSPYFEFIGYRIKTVKQGYVQPDFSDYFHLSVGDILYWHEFTGYRDDQQTKNNKYHIDTLKYSYISADSVYYEFKQTNFDENGKLVNAINRSYQYLRKDEGKMFDNQTSWYGITSDIGQPSEIYLVRSVTLEIENKDTITFIDYDLPGCKFIKSTCKIYPIFDYYRSFGYSTREGRIFQGTFAWSAYSITLVGSIINGVKHGITEIPTGINLLDRQRLKVYPNPVKNYLTINYPDHLIDHIEIYNVAGNLIRNVKIKEKIDLSALSSGAYILKIVETSKAIRQLKIMKQ